MIHVFATVEVVEGKRDLFLEELNRIIPLVRSENGCLEYGPAEDVPIGIPVQDPINKDTITIIERWSDVEALKNHLATPHMQSYREATKGYVVKLVGLRGLAPL